MRRASPVKTQCSACDTYATHPLVCPGVERTSSSCLPKAILAPSLTLTSDAAPLAVEMTDLTDGMNFLSRPVPVM